MASRPEVTSLSVVYDKAAGKILLEARVASENPIDSAFVSFGVCSKNSCTTKTGDDYGKLSLDPASGTWKGYYLVSSELAESGTLSLFSISVLDTLLKSTLYRNNDNLSRPLRDVSITGDIGRGYVFKPGASSAPAINELESIIDVSGSQVSEGTEGSDLFFFRNPFERDTITDFSSEDGDLIALSKAGFEGIDKIRFKSAKNPKGVRKLEAKKPI